MLYAEYISYSKKLLHSSHLWCNNQCSSVTASREFWKVTLLGLHATQPKSEKFNRVWIRWRNSWLKCVVSILYYIRLLFILFHRNVWSFFRQRNCIDDLQEHGENFTHHHFWWYWCWFSALLTRCFIFRKWVVFIQFSKWLICIDTDPVFLSRTIYSSNCYQGNKHRVLQKERAQKAD